MLGLQSWIALPVAHEETAPSFQHFASAVLPVVEDGGVRARIIAGHAFGAASPVATLSDWFYVEVSLAAGASAPLDADHEERAIYVVDGAIEVAGDRFEAPAPADLPGDELNHRPRLHHFAIAAFLVGALFRANFLLARNLGATVASKAHIWHKELITAFRPITRRRGHACVCDDDPDHSPRRKARQERKRRL